MSTLMRQVPSSSRISGFLNYRYSRAGTLTVHSVDTDTDSESAWRAFAFTAPVNANKLTD